MTQDPEPKRAAKGLAAKGLAAKAAALGVVLLAAGGAGYAFWPSGDEPTLGLAGGVEPAWRRFAVDSPALHRDIGKPLIALVIAPEEGAGDGALSAAEALEAPVTLVLRGGDAARAARERGHEALLALGSAGIAGDAARDAAAAAGARVQAGLPAEENEARMDGALADHGQGYVGLAILDDRAAGRDPQLMRSVLTTAQDRGLLVVNGAPSGGGKGYLIARRLKAAPARVDVLVDADRDPAAMARALTLAEETAAKTGACVAFARAHPDTLAAIARWLKNRRGGAEIVPLSAVVAARLRQG